MSRNTRTPRHRTDANAVAYDRANDLRTYIIYRPQAEALRDAGFPFLVDGSRDGRLFAYLLRATRRENDDGEWVIPYSKTLYAKIIANNRNAKWRDRDRPVDHLLSLMKKIDGTIEYNEHRYTKHRACEITTLILPSVITEILYKQPGLRRGGFLDLVNGQPLSGKHLAAKMAEILDMTEAENDLLAERGPDTTEKREFLRYLNHLPQTCITKESIATAGAWLNAQAASGEMNENEEQAACASLLQFEVTRHGGFYGWTENSPRIYGTHGYCLQSVLGGLRRTLAPAVVEVDLRSCHPTIYASIFGAHVMGKFLATGQHFRQYLAEQMGWPWDEDRVVDGAIKTVVCAMLYGQSTRKFFVPLKVTATQLERESALEAKVRRFLCNITEAERQRFRRIPEVKDLLCVRRQILAQITRDGGMADYAGRWWMLHPVEQPGGKDFTALSVLNAVVSSYEWALLEPIRRWVVAQQGNYHAVTVPIYSHDGLSFTCPPREVEHYVSMFRGMVERCAEQLGIAEMTLEVKYDGITRKQK